MSQFKNLLSLHTASQATIRMILTLAVTSPITANADVTYTPRKTPTAVTKIIKSNFENPSQQDFRQLDWRNPQTILRFDAPENNWVEDIELLLSGIPTDTVSTALPLTVSLNNAPPIVIRPRGNRFDARVKLKASYFRTTGNVIKITYQAPATAACLTQSDGGYKVNMNQSFIVMKAHAKQRNLRIKEVADMLHSESLAPKTVSILTRGANTLKLQALASQGLAMRMNEMPDLRLTSGQSDMEIIVATRDKLKGLVTDQEILDGFGPKIYVHKGTKPKIVITADVPQDLLALSKTFASRKLPETRREAVSFGELKSQPEIKTKRIQSGQRTKIAALDNPSFGHSWSPNPKVIKFNLDDPRNQSGNVILHLSNSKNVAERSKVSVALNGTALGLTNLDKKRKTVAFNIPVGTLKGHDNTLTITPDLHPKNSDIGCGITQALSGLSLRKRSAISLHSNTPSPITELSRFTSSGAPFSNNAGNQSQVIFTARASSDLAASLKIIGQLAKVSGHSWANADFVMSSNFDATTATKNLLVIGPRNNIPTPVITNAPKSLTTALRGHALTAALDDNAAITRVASLDNNETLRLAARKISTRSRVKSGGVAALYIQDGRMIGLITNTGNQSFNRSVDALIDDNQWNELSGSVSRWNKNTVLMAQVAKPTALSARITSDNTINNKLSIFQNGQSKLLHASNYLADTAMALGDIAKVKWDAALGFLINETSSKTQSVNTSYANLKAYEPPHIKRTKITNPVVTPQQFPTKQSEPGKTAEIRSVNLKSIPTPQLKLRGPISERKPVSVHNTVNWSALAGKVKHLSKWKTISWRDFGLQDDINTLQRKTSGLRRYIARVVGNSPVGEAKNAVIWSERNTSTPGILLVLVFISGLFILAFASPSSRLGGHH